MNLINSWFSLVWSPSQILFSHASLDNGLIGGGTSLCFHNEQGLLLNTQERILPPVFVFVINGDRISTSFWTQCIGINST